MSSAGSARSLRSQLGVLFFARATTNVAQRIVYPFLPSVASGLGISLAAATGLVALYRLPGLGAPLLGPAADRYGRRRTIQAALSLFVLAGIVLTALGNLWAAVASFFLYGLSKSLLDPSVYALVGDSVPYDERGRAIGLLELNWSLAWLVGVPIAGFMIERFGWRSPWVVLTVLGFVSICLVRLVLPRAGVARLTGQTSVSLKGLVSEWRRVWRRPGVRVVLLVSLLLTLAIEIPFIVYGAWLEGDFGLSLSRLGLASMVIGVAEGVAEVGSSALTDRWGKVRSILIGLLALAASLVALPWLASLGVTGALSGIALAVLAFEFSIVSVLPLATELAPDARASLLSFSFMAIYAGRILGSLSGGWLWQWQPGGISLQAFSGAGCAAAATVLLILGRRGIAQL